jgi:hypothetical protein
MDILSANKRELSEVVTKFKKVKKAHVDFVFFNEFCDDLEKAEANYKEKIKYLFASNGWTEQEFITECKKQGIDI